MHRKGAYSSTVVIASLPVVLFVLGGLSLPVLRARADPGVLYAAPAAGGSGDCSSWANACTLQTALAAADSGDEIWVRAGVHKPTSDPDDRAAVFALKSGVGVYGGFAGAEDSREQRDWQANPTILSGDIDSNDTNSDGNFVAETASDIQGDNAYHVLDGNLTDDTAVLDGFVITAGQANGAAPHDSGGGMRNQDSSPRLTDIIFSGNTAVDGGGMYTWNSHPQLTDVIFTGNAAANNGGGMNNNWYSAPVLVRVLFEGNSAENGGGLANAGEDLGPVLQDVTFSNNGASAGGGGLYNSSGNTTQEGVYTNVTFSGNTAVEGGAMHNWNVPGPVLTNGLFIDNRATDGGAVYSYRSAIVFINATFTNNTASSRGGAMHSYWDRGPVLKNAILWGNSAPEGPEIYINFADTTVSFSDVQGCGGSGAGWDSACGTDDGGNVDADPRFADAAGGDLWLDPASPAIDAGSNAAVPAGVAADLDGNPRLADVPGVPDTGVGDAPIVDMGAYEAQVNVTMAKSVAPSVVEPGQDIAFTLALANRGSMTATQVVVTDAVPAWLWGVSFTSTLTLTGTGSIPPFVWLAPDLAPGQGGVITVSGALTAPLAAGTYTNTAIVSAAGDAPAENNTGTITFTVSNVAPAFTSAPVVTATQGAPYTVTVAAEDGNGDALTIAAPTLPGWLAFTDHGGGAATLSGTPTDANVGDHAVVLRVTDSGGLADTQAFTVTVWGRVYIPLVLRSTS